jgi:hypothetical protein
MENMYKLPTMLVRAWQIFIVVILINCTGLGIWKAIWWWKKYHVMNKIAWILNFFLSLKYQVVKIGNKARGLWLMPVILTTQDVEIRRIPV